MSAVTSSANTKPSPGVADGGSQPKQYGWGVRFAAWAGSALLWLLMHLLFLTCRKRVFGRSAYEQSRRDCGMRAVCGSWHRGLFYTVFHFRNDNAVIMSSRSKDGELVTAVLHRFGYAAPRGSSSKGGKQALTEFVELVASGRTGGLAVDAPRGPAYEVKYGAIAAASRARAPLFPFAWSASRAFRFRSWDRTELPLPFSTIVAAYDHAPVTVPQDAPREVMEAARSQFRARLRRLTYQVDHWHQQGNSHLDPRDIDVPEQFELE